MNIIRFFIIVAVICLPYLYIASLHMFELSLVSIIWSLSFSLIGLFISPFVDPYLAVLIRIICGLIIFTPFVRKTASRDIWQLMIIGACQFGLTYIFLYQSFKYISVIEVLLFSITTPIYIVMIHSFFERRIEWRAFAAAFLAVIGAAIIRYQAISPSFVTGFLLMQAANFVFAFGQAYYQRTQKRSSKNYQNFFWFFAGAFMIVFPAYLLLGQFRFTAQTSTILALIYAGFLATGLGQYLWLQGATKVSAGTLSVMNNLVIPLGIIINLLFGGIIDMPIEFTIGSTIILFSLWVAKSRRKL